VINFRVADYYRPTLCITPLKTVAGKLYSLAIWVCSGEGAPLPAQILAGQHRRQSPNELRFSLSHFLPRSTSLKRTGPETATRPSCGDARLVNTIRSSATGARSKQAHDEHHDWIGIRRGRCLGCGKTFTFLPLLSLPCTHYSLLARCQALRRRFAEHCSWEEATPTLKDSNRVPDPSTLRRWASGLECSQLAPSFLRQTLARVSHWLTRAWLLSWLTPVLQILSPLRL